MRLFTPYIGRELEFSSVHVLQTGLQLMVLARR